MKAAVAKAPGILEVEDLPDPECPKGGALLKVEACAVCGTDIKMLEVGHKDLSFPRVLGHEIVGRILELDRQGDEVGEGDLVQIWPGIACGRCRSCLRGNDNHCSNLGIMGFNLDGGFAETLALPQECLPRGLNLLPRVSDPGLLALAEPLACCLNGQESTGVFEGERVLILGGGPIGSLHASLARWNGADKILMSEKIEERRRRIRGVADRVINPLEESLEDVVLEETGSEGVDVIFTATPEIHVGNSLLSLLAPGGRVCIFSGPKPDNYQEPFDIRSVHYREWTVTGSYGCSSRHDKRAVELLLSGSLNLDWLITLRAPLERIQEAFNHARERKGMKSLIKFS